MRIINYEIIALLSSYIEIGLNNTSSNNLMFFLPSKTINYPITETFLLI